MANDISCCKINQFAIHSEIIQNPINECSNMPLKSLLFQRLGEEVRVLIYRVYLGDVDILLLHRFSDKMALELDVLRSLAPDKVVGKLDGPLVTPYRRENTTSFVTSFNSMDADSDVDKTATCCVLEYHDIQAPPRNTAPPETERQLSIQVR